MASGAGSTPEEGSMASAKEDGVLALEDQPATGLGMELVVRDAHPRGDPTVYGPTRSGDARKRDGKGRGGSKPVEVNPFWSQTMKDEAMLRAMRPASLPTTSSASAAAGNPGEDEVGVDLRDIMKMVMSQNSMLKKELAELRKRVEDTEKVKVVRDVRDFKEGSVPAPPKGTPPPSPPAGPPPKSPEEIQKEKMKEMAEIPEFPEWTKVGLRPGQGGRSGVFHVDERGAPPVPARSHFILALLEAKEVAREGTEIIKIVLGLERMVILRANHNRHRKRCYVNLVVEEIKEGGSMRVSGR